MRPSSNSVRAIATGVSLEPFSSCQVCSGTSTIAVSGNGAAPPVPASSRPSSSMSNAQREMNGCDSAADSAGVALNSLAPHWVS